jgi:FKBP-type peptidyl-prolyl cis-trans isomerases 1
MKKSLLIFLCSSLLLVGGSCIKGDENCQPKTIASETGAMQALATNQGMVATTHSSGLLYEIVNPGAGMTAGSTSRIYIRYTAKLPDGTIFETQTNHTLTGWVLSGLIHGWQIAVPLIQEGGRIKIVVPSSMAYGCASVGNIPSNSILYFDIELVDVQ